MSTKRKQFGQGMTEYIILVAVIAIAALGMFQTFGKELSTKAQEGSKTIKELKMEGSGNGGGS